MQRSDPFHNDTKEEKCGFAFEEEKGAFCWALNIGSASAAQSMVIHVPAALLQTARFATLAEILNRRAVGKIQFQTSAEATFSVAVDVAKDALVLECVQSGISLHMQLTLSSCPNLEKELREAVARASQAFARRPQPSHGVSFLETNNNCVCM